MNSPTTYSPMITPREACLFLFGKDDRTTVQRLYRMIKRNQIKARRCGGTWYISRQVLHDFIS